LIDGAQKSTSLFQVREAREMAVLSTKPDAAAFFAEISYGWIGKGKVALQSLSGKSGLLKTSDA